MWEVFLPQFVQSGKHKNLVKFNLTYYANELAPSEKNFFRITKVDFYQLIGETSQI